MVDDVSLAERLAPLAESVDVDKTEALAEAMARRQAASEAFAAATADVLALLQPGTRVALSHSGPAIIGIVVGSHTPTDIHVAVFGSPMTRTKWASDFLLKHGGCILKGLGNA